MKKKDAFKVLKECERKAKKLIVVFTPIQPNLGDNEELLTSEQILRFEAEKVGYKHLSIWQPKEFEALGYEVIYHENYHTKRTNGKIPWGIIIAYKKL
jgi:hypothetical protein